MSASQYPLRRPGQPEVIPNQYIVVFKSGVSSVQRQSHRKWVDEQAIQAFSPRTQGEEMGALLHKFNICQEAVTGYCCRVPEALAREIDALDEVEFVEADMKVYACDLVKQEGAPSWGLARLNTDDMVTEENRGTYIYDDDAAGKGTYSYIIDTGILAEHEDFEERAVFGFNAVRGSSNTDKNGHGTHVAGTIGSKTYGVAKATQLIGVKVLGDDGSGSNSTVMAGIEWALADAQQKGITKCVANMSLGGGFSRALNRTVATAIQRGLTMVVAAGNEGTDASKSSPASEPTAITVGAFGITDAAPSWSNYGTLVDIYAPGVDISSTWIDETSGVSVTEVNTISGTSMAAPHVAGLIAYYISKHPELDTPAKLTAHLKKLGVSGKLAKASLKGGSVNLVASNGERGTLVVEPTPPPPPVSEPVKQPAEGTDGGAAGEMCN